MVKLSKYLIRDFLVTFSMAMLLITFAFSIGAIYKAVDVMAKGLPVSTVGRFFLYNLPYSIAFTIPLSALFSALLLFGRLSADSEVSAMKSGGLSLWQIASPIVFVSFILVLLCLYNNCVVYPRATLANRQLLATMGVADPIKLLEEGQFIREFPGYMIYVGQKKQNRVRDLIVYEVDEDTGRVTGTIRAARGIMTTDDEKSILNIDLYDVRIEIPNAEAPNDATKTRYISASEYPIRLDFKELMGKNKIPVKRKYMTFYDLLDRIRHPGDYYPLAYEQMRQRERGRDLIELNQRICLAVAPLMFVLIAIPLGIKSHRKESSAGMLISLCVVTIYYIFIILSDTFEESYALKPWLFPWIPIVGGQIAGILLLRRAD
ncbi:MAG: LptF/LptG family permease [Pontiellaceae bacterium]|nr:LptF/LptG family permease [Pontiellaceae bacterium]MBN2784559.1 LptF/LptG family permease [Pontiellaceae bacterium]